MRTLILYFCMLLPFSLRAQSSYQMDSLAAKTLSPQQMTEDFHYLLNMLKQSHPGLYRYTPKDSLQKKIDSIQNQLSDSMSFYKYYGLVSGFAAAIRCAHTYIVPSQDMNSYMTRIKTIPLELLPVGGRMYVTLSGTMDSKVLPGYELLSINGMPVASVLEQIYGHTWMDGFIRQAKVHQASGLRFGLFLYLFVCRPDSFDLSFRTPEGALFSLSLPSAPYSEYSKIFLQNPVNKTVLDIYLPRNKLDNTRSWRLELLKQPNAALLVFRRFAAGNSSESAAEKMREFMDKTIRTLRRKKIENLIIDLRSNNGGWDAQGVELLRYLVKDTASFRYFGSAHVITNDTALLKFSDLSARDKADLDKELIPGDGGKFFLREKYNKERGLQKPAANRFTGKIYFLTNGGTASAAAEFTAVAHSMRLGTFIGTETGGAYEGGNGGSFLHFHLPHSGLYAGSPLVYSENAVDKPSMKGRGTIPDYIIGSTMGDVLTGNDAQLEFALQLIKEQKAN